MIIVEQQPLSALRLCDMAIGLRNVDPGLDRRSGVARHGFEITPLGRRGLRPGRRNGPVTGNRSFRRDRGHVSKLVEPAEKTAVNYRDAVDEQEIGKPKGTGL